MNKSYVTFIISIILIGLLANCGKDDSSRSSLNSSSTIASTAQLKGNLGHWDFKPSTKEEFKAAQLKAFFKMGKRIKAASRRANAMKGITDMEASPIQVSGDGPSDNMHIKQAPPPDSIPTPEEIELYMTEEIAQELFTDVKPSILNFSNSYLDLDLTDNLYYGSANEPGIMRTGIILEFCQGIESQGLCLDSVAMGLTGGMPLKVSGTVAAECLLDALGLGVTVMAGTVGTLALVLTKKAFKTFLIGAGFPAVGLISAGIMFAKWGLCCYNNS